MSNLEILDVSGGCCIYNAKLKEINVVELHALFNPKISNIQHMSKLKKLYALNICGINDNGLKGLNLFKLDARDNEKITNVCHMTNLKNLNVSQNCGINNSEIKKLNLVKLYDGHYPENNIVQYLSYYMMTKEEFDSVLDKHVNKKLFYKCEKSKIWKAKFEIDKDFQI